MISWDACEDLRAWIGSDRSTPTRGEIIAVHVLTHEAMHMAGELSESVAECRAVQRDARTAMALGASHEQARRLARSYWLQVYPQMPDDYRTSDCRRPAGPSTSTSPMPPGPPEKADTLRNGQELILKTGLP